ncbi:MAG: cyanoexosortase B system-associated protein [Leptolyngbyaceae cyanobacterium]
MMNEMIQRQIRGKPISMWVAVMLLSIAVMAIAPNYITGQWTWVKPAALPGNKVLQSVKTSGLELPGWTVIDQHTQEIGNKKWSLQALTTDAWPTLYPDVTISDRQADVLQENSVSLFLRPQTSVGDDPLVEWIDIGTFLSNFQSWTVDDQRVVKVSTSLGDSSGEQNTGNKTTKSISTRYFRGWQRIQGDDGLLTTYTYAVMQWYAWPTGGGPKISDWFWADQWQQWRDRQRVPWVAVTLMVPIEPLGDIAEVQPLVEAIAQTVQTTLANQISGDNSNTR